MYCFSYNEDKDQNIGELVLETLLSNSVDSLIELDLGFNPSWFKHPVNIGLLAELISIQTRLQIISLTFNKFSNNAT